MSAGALHAAFVVGAAVFSVGVIVLLKWVCEPVLEAKRLNNEVDDPQEQTYEDPLDRNAKTKLYVRLPTRCFQVCSVCRLTALSPFMSPGASLARWRTSRRCHCRSSSRRTTKRTASLSRCATQSSSWTRAKSSSRTFLLPYPLRISQRDRINLSMI
jgi:hypothetical protein